MKELIALRKGIKEDIEEYYVYIDDYREKDQQRPSKVYENITSFLL